MSTSIKVQLPLEDSSSDKGKTGPVYAVNYDRQKGTRIQIRRACITEMETAGVQPNPTLIGRQQ
jgi:hypothetical protein